MAPIVSRLNFTPVKGSALIHPQQVKVTAQGIAEDRRFYVLDRKNHFLTNAGCGPMMRMVARWKPETQFLALEFPDGTRVEGSAADLGASVTLDFFGRDVGGQVVEGPFAEAISRFVGQPVRLVRTRAGESGIDVEPITLVSTESISRLATDAVLPNDLDPSRFRMNIELSGCSPYEEDTWEGREISLGTAVLEIIGKVPRCLIVDLDPKTGLKDHETLRAIASHRERMPGPGLPMGVYAKVKQQGVIRLGDAIA